MNTLRSSGFIEPRFSVLNLWKIPLAWQLQINSSVSCQSVWWQGRRHWHCCWVANVKEIESHL